MVYVSYKYGQAMNSLCEEKGLRSEDRAILYLILTIVGLEIVNMALIQNDLNQLSTIR